MDPSVDTAATRTPLFPSVLKSLLATGPHTTSSRTGQMNKGKTFFCQEHGQGKEPCCKDAHFID